MTVPEGIMIVLAGAQLAYAAFTYHGDRAAQMQSDPAKRPRRPLFIIGTFMLLTWGAVAFDYLTRPEVPEADMVSYGIDPGNHFHAIVQFRAWENYKNFKGTLLANTIFANRDRVTDTWLAKSGLYTIDGPILVLAFVGQQGMHVAVNSKNSIEYDFVVLPPEIGPEQIRMLSDVPRLGGKILAGGIYTTFIPSPPPLPDK
jgi:hypothetical protein